MDYRAALIEFYQKYNPEKLREVDLLLAKYKGKEEELLHALRVKYGVHKTVAPTPPPPPAPPPQSEPPPAFQPRNEPHDEGATRPIPPSTQEEEPDFQPPPQAPQRPEREGPLSSSVYKGRSAAERAEYWRKELEKREHLRGNPQPPRNEILNSSKPRKETFKTRLQEEEQEESYHPPADSDSKFPIVKIALITLTVFLAGSLIFMLIRWGFSDSTSLKVGGANSNEQPRADKKEGIEPGVITQNEDTSVSKTPGDFALDNEEDSEEGVKVPSVEDASGESSANAGNVQKKSLTPTATKKPVDNRPSETEENNKATGLHKGDWYLSYITVSQQASAKNAVRDLQSQGIENAGYYFIPDYDPHGKNLYKVYIGPYKSMESAERALDDDLRRISPGSYAYMLK